MKHPIEYDSFVPNVLIDNSWTRELPLNELNLYYSVFTFNHQKDRDKMIYELPYTNISEDTRNKGRVTKRIKKTFDEIRLSIQLGYLTNILTDEQKERYSSFNPNKPVHIKPFITVQPDGEVMRVELHELYKSILCAIDFEFTKADSQLILSFDSQYPKKFYLFARRKQKEKKTHIMSVKELRFELNCENKLKTWNDFHDDAFKKIHEAYQGTWVEFDYQPIKKGKGNRVTGIELTFKNGYVEEVLKSPVGAEKWERALKKVGMTEAQILQIRGYINDNRISKTENGKTITWCKEYVEVSILAAEQEYQRRQADTKVNNVGNAVGWLYNGLYEGYWLESYHNAVLSKNSGQGKLF